MAKFLKDNIEAERRRRELPQEVLWHPCCPVANIMVGQWTKSDRVTHVTGTL